MDAPQNHERQHGPDATLTDGEMFLDSVETGIVTLATKLIESIGLTGGAKDERRDLALQVQALALVRLEDTLANTNDILNQILFAVQRTGWGPSSPADDDGTEPGSGLNKDPDEG